MHGFEPPDPLPPGKGNYRKENHDADAVHRHVRNPQLEAHPMSKDVVNRMLESDVLPSFVGNVSPTSCICEENSKPASQALAISLSIFDTFVVSCGRARM